MTKKLNIGSHDLPVSDRLAEFMKTGWADTENTEVQRNRSADYAVARRARLSAAFPGLRVVIPAGTFRVRVNDSDYRFRASSPYSWLTGIGASEAVPDTVLVLEPTLDGHDAHLYLHPRSPRDTDEFFRDRRHGEFWVGRRVTAKESEARNGIAVRHIDDLPQLLKDGTPTVALRNEDPAVDGLLAPANDRELELLQWLAEARLIKDEYEVEELQFAVDATIRGFEDVVRALPAAKKEPNGERVVEAAFYARAPLEGNEPGYDTIAASGAHACVLHWIRNDGAVKDGDLMLLDAGVEVDSHYTSDVTRTLPVSGSFTPAQRRMYMLVYEAQQAAIAAVKPGARFRDFHRAAMRVIAEGLADWGVLPISGEESMLDEVGLHRRWTLCSTGHMLGLDVHDCAKARAEEYLDGVLQVGNVLTIEPGLYFQPDDLLLPEELRGIGIRIEDDVIVTEDGCRLLTEALPRHPDDIERWMRQIV